MVRRGGGRSGNQRREEGHHSRSSRRRVSVRRADAEVPEVRREGRLRVAVGEGILTAPARERPSAAAQRIGFTRTREGLLCDAVPVERIAKECGTPVYIY